MSQRVEKFIDCFDGRIWSEKFSHTPAGQRFEKFSNTQTCQWLVRFLCVWVLAIGFTACVLLAVPLCAGGEHPYPPFPPFSESLQVCVDRLF